MPRSSASTFVRRLYGLGGPDQPKDQANAALLAFVEMSDAEQRYVQVHLSFLLLEQLEDLSQRLERLGANQVEAHKRVMKRLQRMLEALDQDDEEEEAPLEEGVEAPEEEVQEEEAPAAPAPATARPPTPKGNRRPKAPAVEGELVGTPSQEGARFEHPPAAE